MYAELTRKKCNKCEKVKNVSEFYMASKCKDPNRPSYRHICRECERIRHAEYVEKNKDAINRWRRERYKKDPGRFRAEVFKYRYGITADEYQDLYDQQKGRCAICGTHESKLDRKLDIDHCHDTKIIRGLLCRACNRGIGFFEDDVERLKSAIKFLRKSKK